jgi:hypothetical protein
MRNVLLIVLAVLGFDNVVNVRDLSADIFSSIKADRGRGIMVISNTNANHPLTYSMMRACLVLSIDHDLKLRRND